MPADLRSLVRLTTHAVIVSSILFGPLTLRAQNAHASARAVAATNSRGNSNAGSGAFTYSVPGAAANSAPGQAVSQLVSTSHGGSLGDVSLGIVVSGYLHSGTPGNSGTNEVPVPSSGGSGQIGADPAGANGLTFTTSSDPFKSLEAPTGSTPGLGLAPTVDGMLPGGSDFTTALWPRWNGDAYSYFSRGGNYFTAGTALEIVLRKHTAYPVTVSFPINMEVGAEQYFMGPAYGYVTAGINVRVPLSFIPSRYGKWTVGTSVDMCYYGTSPTEFVASMHPQLPKLGAALSVDL